MSAMLDIRISSKKLALVARRPRVEVALEGILHYGEGGRE